MRNRAHLSPTCVFLFTSPNIAMLLNTLSLVLCIGVFFILHSFELPFPSFCPLCLLPVVIFNLKLTF